MEYEIAYQKAKNDLQGASPYVVSSKSGVPFEGGKFVVPFFHRRFLVHHPEVKVEELGNPAPPRRWLEIVLMHYLLGADGTPIAETWITYRHLPGAQLFERRFEQMAINRLLQNFSNDAERLRQACLSIGGTPMSRTGDVAFRFLALPKIPMGCILYLGDEEVRPSVTVLFDAAAPRYLPTEDLSLVGTYLATALVSYKRPAKGPA